MRLEAVVRNFRMTVADDKMTRENLAIVAQKDDLAVRENLALLKPLRTRAPLG